MLWPFFALLGWHTRVTFNLPLPYPLLTKIGLYIWITEGVLIIYFLAFKWVWPPLVFFLGGCHSLALCVRTLGEK